jgi:hypothetical protein
MGYRTRVEGEFSVSPPLSWKEIRESPFRNYGPGNAGRSYKATDIDLLLEVNEEETETEEGVMIVRTASRFTMPHYDDYRAHNLLEQVQRIVDMFGEHKFSGRLECEGEDNTDIWRVKIHSGIATKVKPEILWPGEVEALCAAEEKRIRKQAFDEVWRALRDTGEGTMILAMNLVLEIRDRS